MLIYLLGFLSGIIAKTAFMLFWHWGDYEQFYRDNTGGFTIGGDNFIGKLIRTARGVYGV